MENFKKMAAEDPNNPLLRKGGQIDKLLSDYSLTVRDPFVPTKNKGIKVDLNQGDMLVYRGCELEHWRNKFKGKDCAQVFLHYNNEKTPGSSQNLFDKRPHLGLPSWFKT